MPEIWEVSSADLSDVDSDAIENAARLLSEAANNMESTHVAIVSNNPIKVSTL